MKSLLFSAVIFSLSRHSSTLFPSAFAAVVSLNRTIDDTSPAIIYAPADNWIPSSNTSCAICPQAEAQFAFNGTLHYGLHPFPQSDTDLITSSASQSGLLAPSVGPAVANGPVITPNSPTTPTMGLAAPTSHPAPAPGGVAPPPIASPSVVPTSTLPSIDGPSNTPGGASTDTDTETSSSSGRLARSMILRRATVGDLDFVDIQVTATVSFTGTACYVYCALPVQSNNPAILSKVNLTFILDGQPAGKFTHDPLLDSNPGFEYQIPVFSQAGLSFGNHVLVIQPELGSVVLLDSIVYTTLTSDSSSANATSDGGMPGATPSGSVDSHGGGHSSSKAKNTATFAAALGSTLGVLALLSLGVCISLIRRRRVSAEREKRREAEERAGRPPSPEMRGPQPFIPRFFPGYAPTISPPADLPMPPPISASLSSPHSEELGPSHGLDFPPAPEHSQTPAYKPPSLAFSDTPGRISTSPRPPPVMRKLSPHHDPELPLYQDVGQTPFVSLAISRRAPRSSGSTTLPSASPADPDVDDSAFRVLTDSSRPVREPTRPLGRTNRTPSP